MADENGGFTPPYVPFKTFLTFLDKMAEKGLPPQLDTSALEGFSGTAQYHLMHALRSLDLIDADGVVSQDLVKMVEKPEMRKDYLRDALLRHYMPVIELGEKNATAAQLHTWFRGFSISGSTVRKAVRFYLQAAEYTDLPVSPHFKPPSAPKTPKKSKKKVPEKTANDPAVQADAGEPPDPGIESLRMQYIEKLMAQALDDKQGKTDSELLDRLERLLGFGEESMD